MTASAGRGPWSGELVRNIYACLIAEANLGLVGMAEASGIPYDVLAWTAEWYLREETWRRATTARRCCERQALTTAARR
jgi:hypothetical protein